MPPPGVPRRPRELAPRERDVVLRRVAAARGLAALVGEVFAAAAVDRFAVERFAGDLRAVDARVAPEPDDFARAPDFALGLDLALGLDFVAGLDFERLDVDFAAVFRAPLLREADARFVLRLGDVLRAEEEDEGPLVVAEPSIDHLPDITRCAASATASAMIEPSFVALVAIAVAAWLAVSAASSPASRIFFRAAGLALIAAAAAASPAASISLLIAAFASLSTVVFFELELDEDELDRGDDEREDVEREELLRVDLAIVYLPPFVGKDTLRPFRFPNEVQSAPAGQGNTKFWRDARSKFQIC